MKLSLVARSSFLVAALALASCALAGCTSDDSTSTAPGPIAFTAEAPADGASVFLREQKSILPPAPGAPAQSRVVIEVVARGAADLHGAAFRVTWDPEALGFVEAQSGPPWSKTALAIAKEGSPGQLAVAWTEKGELGVDATSETVLGTLVFEARGRKGTALGFKAERSQLVDKKGARVAATWRGGAIPAR